MVGEEREKVRRRRSRRNVRLTDVRRITLAVVLVLARQMMTMHSPGCSPDVPIPKHVYESGVVGNVDVDTFGWLPLFLSLVAHVATVCQLPMVLHSCLLGACWVWVGSVCVACVKADAGPYVGSQ